MANADKPSGLRPVKHLDGSPWNGMTRPYLFDAANAVYVGDPVKLGGSAGAAGLFVAGYNCEGMPNAERAAAGDTLLGVVVGFAANPPGGLETQHKAADGTDRIGFVVDSPDVVFEVQEDSVGNTIAVTAVGNNFDMVTWLAGNSAGISAVELDSSDTSGTSTAQLRLLRFVPRPDNELGTNAKWEVVINEHVFKTATGV